MVGTDKKKISDLFKKKEVEKKDIKVSGTAGPAKKPVVKKPVSSTASKKAKPAGGSLSGMNASKVKADSMKLKARIDAAKAAQLKVLHSKTYQDFINASYKAAEKLKTDPWKIMNEAGWGDFHKEREKMYDGPILEEVKGLTDEWRQALKEVLGVK